MLLPKVDLNNNNKKKITQHTRTVIILHVFYCDLECNVVSIR